jgi:hypothetical protein
VLCYYIIHTLLLYLISYTIIIYYYYYTLLLLYIILISSSSLLLISSSSISSSSSSNPNPPHLFLPLLPNIHSILVGTYIYLFIFYSSSSSDLSLPSQSSIIYTLLFFLLPLQSSSLLNLLLSFSIPSTPQYSFYTCRYLHILIYIPDSSSQYLQISDPARSIGVDG